MRSSILLHVNLHVSVTIAQWLTGTWQECAWTSAAVHLMSRHWQCLVTNYLQIMQSKWINSVQKYHAQLQLSFILLPLPLPTQFWIILESYHSNVQQKCLQNSRCNIQQHSHCTCAKHTHCQTARHSHCQNAPLKLWLWDYVHTNCIKYFFWHIVLWNLQLEIHNTI